MPLWRGRVWETGEGMVMSGHGSGKEGSWEVGVSMEGKTWYRGQTVGGMAWQ